jgi:hypothetical protein
MVDFDGYFVKRHLLWPLINNLFQLRRLLPAPSRSIPARPMILSVESLAAPREENAPAGDRRKRVLNFSGFSADPFDFERKIG